MTIELEYKLFMSSTKSTNWRGVGLLILSCAVHDGRIAVAHLWWSDSDSIVLTSWSLFLEMGMHARIHFVSINTARNFYFHPSLAGCVCLIFFPRTFIILHAQFIAWWWVAYFSKD